MTGEVSVIIPKVTGRVKNGGSGVIEIEDTDVESPEKVPTKISWKGNVPYLKWMTFYTKVFTKYHEEDSLKISVNFEIEPRDGVVQSQVDELRAALKELGLEDKVDMG